MTIRILSDQVINQIAAGEVVERPVSVVRELVDNAIDAGATRIAINIENGGQTLITVQDNGSGMTAADAELAFRRHATSKIQLAEDLERVSTLGFRGEALPSIAAVSRVRLVTRTADNPLAIEVSVEAGSMTLPRQVAEAAGTRVEVRDLFFNTPARRKFLKSPRSDESRIKRWIEEVALVRPEIHFSLSNEVREVLNLAPRQGLYERAEEYLRCPALRVDHSAGPLRVRGLVAHPQMAGNSSAAMLIYVNARPIADRMLLRAVRQGFGATLRLSEYPCGALWLDLAPEFVDINVHPQKSEVRFRSAQAVFGAVQAAVRIAVQEFKLPLNSAAATSRLETATPIFLAGSVPQLQELPPLCGGSEQQPFAFTEESGGGHFTFGQLKYIGQLLGCYLLCEADGQFYVVDMHAAHERINFNKLRSLFSGGGIGVQQLLVPHSVQLSEEEVLCIMENCESFKELGFEIEQDGADRILVKCVPGLGGTLDLSSLFSELARQGAELFSLGELERRLELLAARVACHASVRGGDKLSTEEVYALFGQLDQNEFSAACPHGRPVVVSFSRAQVERWFGRDK